MTPTPSFKTTIYRYAPLAIFAIFAILFWVVLGGRAIWFSNAVGETYQYSSPFAQQQGFLDFKLPFLGGFWPYSDGWGQQWPFYMVFKSALYTMVPYSPALDKLLALFFVFAGGCLIQQGITRALPAPYLGLLCGIIYMSDERLLNFAEGGRSEPFTAFLLAGIPFAYNGLRHRSHATLSTIVLLVVFFLLPGTHPHGLTICGGLIVIHMTLFRRWYHDLHWALRFLPLIAYSAGIVCFLSWFKLSAADGEQMGINRQVQELIYATASRFEYFLQFIPGHRFLSGYVFWGSAIAISGVVFYQVVNSLAKRGKTIPEPGCCYSSGNRDGISNPWVYS